MGTDENTTKDKATANMNAAELKENTFTSGRLLLYSVSANARVVVLTAYLSEIIICCFQ